MLCLLTSPVLYTKSRPATYYYYALSSYFEGCQIRLCCFPPSLLFLWIIIIVVEMIICICTDPTNTKQFITFLSLFYEGCIINGYLGFQRSEVVFQLTRTVNCAPIPNDTKYAKHAKKNQHQKSTRKCDDRVCKRKMMGTRMWQNRWHLLKIHKQCI